MRNYRGLTKEGKWVYGYHLAAGPENNVSHYILPHENAVWMSKTFSLNEDEDFITGFVEVIPETVGQSTGRKDKNGTEIYEGDIVYFWLYRCCKEETGVIRWQQEKHRFIFVERSGKHSDWGFIDKDAFEVIGNIHQNLKLMEQ